MSAKRAFILGHPIRHTISPPMHNAAFEILGIDARYSALDVAPADLKAAIDRLREPDVLGANVTVPHKQAVMALLDEVSDEAAAIGAVNTVVNRDGRLCGYNTDAPGFLMGLAEAGFEPRGARAALIGAGGAARAIASALIGSGIGELFILNRNSQRAVELARDLVVHFGARSIWGLPLSPGHIEDQIPHCELLVNATTVGMHGEASPIPAEMLRPTMLVVDIIYNPPRTELLAVAESAGARTQNGLPMLVYQAAAAFELWTAQPASIPAMRSAAQAALRTFT